jgi:hypothetical protein
VGAIIPLSDSPNHYSQEEQYMKNKILAVLMVLGFAGGLAVTSVSFAGSDATAKACKGKKPGDMVKVDGKDVKCPEAKK